MQFDQKRREFITLLIQRYSTPRAVPHWREQGIGLETVKAALKPGHSVRVLARSHEDAGCLAGLNGQSARLILSPLRFRLSSPALRAL
jgi:hypothetical protein